MQSNSPALKGPALPGLLRDAAPELRQYLERRIPFRLKSVISAEDIVQEVWIDAFQALPNLQLRGRAALDRWLTTIARRKLVNAIRAVQRLKRGGGRALMQQYGQRASTLVDVLVGLVSQERTPSSMVAVTEAAKVVTTAMSELPQECRRAVWLRFVAGHHTSDVAKIMNRTTGSVRALIFRGLRQMKSQLGSASKYLSDASSERELVESSC